NSTSWLRPAGTRRCQKRALETRWLHLLSHSADQLMRQTLRLQPETLRARSMSPEGGPTVATIGLRIAGRALKVGAQLVRIGTHGLIPIWPPRERISDGLRVACLPGRLGERSRQRSMAALVKINRSVEPAQILDAPLVELAGARLRWRPDKHESGNDRYRDNCN